MHAGRPMYLIHLARVPQTIFGAHEVRSQGMGSPKHMARWSPDIAWEGVPKKTSGEGVPRQNFGRGHQTQIGEGIPNLHDLGRGSPDTIWGVGPQTSQTNLGWGSPNRVGPTNAIWGGGPQAQLADGPRQSGGPLTYFGLGTRFGEGVPRQKWGGGPKENLGWGQTSSGCNIIWGGGPQTDFGEGVPRPKLGGGSQTAFGAGPKKKKKKHICPESAHTREKLKTGSGQKKIKLFGEAIPRSVRNSSLPAQAAQPTQSPISRHPC